MQSLNPCFNGRCTSTCNNIKNSETYDVLILVLMEDALVPRRSLFKPVSYTRIRALDTAKNLSYEFF